MPEGESFAYFTQHTSNLDWGDSSGSFATLVAIRLASSLATIFAADRRPRSSS
jgi:hypothetical protein